MYKDIPPEIPLEKHIALERKLMDMLLAGDHELFYRLRRQYESATIIERSFSGCGFFTDFVVSDTSTPIYDNNFFMTDVCIDYDGQEYAFGVILFVEGGLIVMLEVYSINVDDWATDYDKIELCYPSKSEEGSQERGIGSIKWLVMENMSSRWWGTLFETGNKRSIWNFNGKDDVFLKKHELFEKKLMDMLLAGDHELFASLKRQYESAIITRRGFNAYAFFADFSVKDEAAAISNKNFVLADVGIDYDGTKFAYEIKLFIDGGFISCLLGYAYKADDWIEDYDKIDDIYNSIRRGPGVRNTGYIKAKFDRIMPSGG
jgi:hypothetical protein